NFEDLRLERGFHGEQRDRGVAVFIVAVFLGGKLAFGRFLLFVFAFLFLDFVCLLGAERRVVVVFEISFISIIDRRGFHAVLLRRRLFRFGLFCGFGLGLFALRLLGFLDLGLFLLDHFLGDRQRRGAFEGRIALGPGAVCGVEIDDVAQQQGA